MKPRWLNKFHAVDGAIVFNELQIVAVSDDIVLAHDVFQKIIGRFSETDLKARKLRGRGRPSCLLPFFGSLRFRLDRVNHEFAADLRQNEWMIDYDEAGAIGRRYRREDEIGTPLCVTVDFDTLDDQAVTIRERDTMQQERVSLDKVADYIAERIGEKRVSVPQMPVEMGGEAWPESVKIAEAGGLY